MRDLRARTVTGVLYGVAVLAAALGPREVFVLALGMATAVALVELIRLARAGLPAVLQLAVLAVGTLALLFLRDLAAFPYIPLLVTILAVWAADVAAYVVGSRLGRRKIVPRISPGKTWEGTIAGFLAASLVVAAAALPSGVHVSWIAAALLVGPSAFAGDLLESWVKRRAGVKDSGRLFPGHGGMLDRIDSLLAAAPVVALSIVTLGRLG